MASTPKALFVNGDAEFKVVEKNELPDIADDELLIKVSFSGVNPADIKHATLLGITNTILGYDFCGKVIEVSNSTSAYKPGDIVAGYTPSGIGRPSKYGTHQAYLACPETMLFKVPANLPEPDAGCLTVVAMTAADTIFNQLQLPLPNQNKEAGPTGPLLLWGATGAVGYCALQFAVASGVSPIFVTAAPDRFEHLESLGATRCFDYKAKNVYESIANVLKELGHDEFQFAFDAAGAPNSADQVLQCISEKTLLVSTVLQQNQRFKMPLATPNLEFAIQPPGVPQPITVPARPADYEKAWKALAWALEHYGTSFRLPPVRVMEDSAEKVLEEINRVVEQGGGFSKLAIKQPMQ